MEIADIERLVEIVQNARVAELTIRQGTSRVTIRTGSSVLTGGTSLVLRPDNTNCDEYGDFIAEESDSIDTEMEIYEPAHFTIFAPSVGIFKHVKPVVGLQASVHTGQIVGVIEAMKLLNDVVCTSEGIVSDVLVEDGMPVEYDQPLFLVQPV